VRRRPGPRRRPAATLLAVALLTLLAAGPADAQQQSVLLDSNDPANDGFAGPVETPQPLAAGRFHVVRVAGSFTAFAASYWDDPRGRTCGQPHPSPVTPSPGAEPRPAGQDAETVFGVPWDRGCPADLPYTYHGFSIDVGNDFFDPEPVTGSTSVPTADSAYEYLVTGNDRPARFRIADTQTDDNSGILRIDVRPAYRRDCGGNPECEAVSPDEPPPPSPAPPFAPAPPQVDRALAGASRCVARRRFRVRIANPRRRPLRAVAVTANGRGVKVRRARVGGRRGFVATIDLRRKRRGRVRIVIVTRAADGTLTRSVRSYRICRKRLRPR
jgi:hypothetical protein